MKRTNFILWFVITSNFVFAQPPKEISDSDLVMYKQEIQNESVTLRLELLKKHYLNDFDKQISVDFQIDTFLIERLQSKRISIDYSTYGMIKATSDSEIEYDKLLNKYYQLLIKKLNDSDKEILKQSQKKWILFRDSEKNLNSAIAKNEYSGGGTMQGITVANKTAEITQKRVIELFNYLNRFKE